MVLVALAVFVLFVRKVAMNLRSSDGAISLNPFV